MNLTEDALEQETLAWFAELGYSVLHGPDIAPDGNNPERDDYRQVVLAGRLRAALHKLNPGIPPQALEDAARELLLPNIPGLEQANRQVQRWLTRGVPVTYQRDGETLGENARLVDFANPANNDWLAVNQYSVQGPHHTRRPDIVVFVNGLPLVVLELKNPADEQADIWKAYNQLQTYKTQISDLFISRL